MVSSNSRHAGGIALRELAERSDAELAGDGDVMIYRVSTLEDADGESISFLSNARYRSQLSSSRAAAVIVAPRDADATPLPKLLTSNPYAVYARIATIFHPPAVVVAGIHPTAIVAATAKIDTTAMIGPNVVVGDRASVGKRAAIHTGCVIGDGCTVGDDVTLYPRVVLYADSILGERAIVHSGAVIGADGFGMAEQDGRWIKVPQVGRVVIGTDVEIGANTTIDRGALGDTVIEDDVKLDNQIQIGHNCRIGAHTAIAGCTGIAGSTTVGRNCKIGGAAMLVGHIDIPDDTTISAMTAVCASIDVPGTYTAAFPALPHRQWQHVASVMRNLREFAERIRGLERVVGNGPEDKTENKRGGKGE
jgi:UDP-3-O-[3-hydroxymyristoyl] glucosamine N-acyltransferase